MSEEAMPWGVWADQLEEAGVSTEQLREWVRWGLFYHDWWDTVGESEHGWGFRPTSGDGQGYNYHLWEETGYGGGSCLDFGSGDVLEEEGEQTHGESLNVHSD